MDEAHEHDVDDPGHEDHITFAEHALLTLDRMDRQMTILRDQMRGADEYLRRVMEQDPTVYQAPIRVRVLNKHVQSIGVTVDRLPGGEIGVIVTHRGADDPGHMLVPNEIHDQEVAP